MTILRCWNCGTPVESAADEFCKPCRITLKRIMSCPGPRQKAEDHPVLSRLIEEVRNEQNTPVAYDRVHSRHNRS